MERVRNKHRDFLTPDILQPAKAGTTLHPAGGNSPFVGYAVVMATPTPGAQQLPPGVGAMGGELDWKAAAILAALERQRK